MATETIVLTLFLLGFATGDRFLSFRNKRYEVISHDTSISQNRIECTSRGMTLAYVRDEMENAFLKQHVVNYLRLGAVWDTDSKSFKWEDGSKMNYTNWNSGSMCTESSNCCTVEMVANGKWNVYTCGSTAHGLCEKDDTKPDVIDGKIGAINETLVAFMEETNERLEQVLNQVRTNVSSTLEAKMDQVIARINQSSENQQMYDNVTSQLNRVTIDFERAVSQMEVRRNKTDQEIQEQIKSLGDQSKQMNQTLRSLQESLKSLSDNHMDVKSDLASEVRAELNSLKLNLSKTFQDDSHLDNQIHQLEQVRDELSQKLQVNEDSVNTLSKRIFVSLAITILLLVALVVTIGQKYYHESKPRFNGFKRQSLSGNSVRDESV